MSTTCWKCSEKLDSQKHLKNHAATNHSTLSVICPFCLHKQRTFKRVSDLKLHVRNTHAEKTEGMPADLFSEPNAFWCSLFPSDYRRVITPTARDHKAAIHMRTLVLVWARRVESLQTRTREEFLEGWKDSELATVPTTSKTCSQHQHIEPAPVHSSSVKVPDCSASITNPGAIDYFDILDAPSVTFISMVPGSVFADLVRGPELFRLTILDEVFSEENKGAKRSLVRRCETQKAEALPFAGFNGAEDSEPSHKTFLAKHLGIPSSLIEKVLRQENESPPLPAVSTLPATLAHPTPTVPVTTHSPCLTSRPQDTSSASLTWNPVKMAVAVGSLASPTVSRKHTAISPSVNPAPPPPKIRRKEILPPPPSQSYRASKLLRMGGMPQWQPARRNWDLDEEVSFSVGDIVIFWPPKGWKQLDHQQKLLQWQFAAMQILRARGADYVNVTLTDLLDSFNFLALPGTDAHKAPRHSASYMASKSRLYTYEFLRAIANGECMDDRWLSMVEGGAMLRDTSNDDLLKQCRSIKLRLTKD